MLLDLTREIREDFHQDMAVGVCALGKFLEEFLTDVAPSEWKLVAFYIAYWD